MHQNTANRLYSATEVAFLPRVSLLVERLTRIINKFVGKEVLGQETIRFLQRPESECINVNSLN